MTTLPPGEGAPRVIPPVPIKPPREPRPWVRKLALGVAAALVALVALGLAVRLLTRPGPVEAAAEECGVMLNLADEGRSLILDTPGTDKTKDVALPGRLASLDDVLCVLDQTEAPATVREHLSSTRALDGQQTDAWGEVEARWSYHPDTGVALVLSER